MAFDSCYRHGKQECCLNKKKEKKHKKEKNLMADNWKNNRNTE